MFHSSYVIDGRYVELGQGLGELRPQLIAYLHAIRGRLRIVVKVIATRRFDYGPGTAYLWEFLLLALPGVGLDKAVVKQLPHERQGTRFGRDLLGRAVLFGAYF